MRDHKINVVKKFYFFKNIALNSSASIQGIKSVSNEIRYAYKDLFYDIRCDYISYV